MQISISKKEGLTHNFKVVVPASDFGKTLDEKLSQLGQKVKLPGFRPGKVPTLILKQRYLGDAMNEAIERSIGEALNTIRSEHKIRQAQQPNVTVDNVGEDKDLEFTLEIEALPQVELKKFNDIKLERPTATIPDEAVEDHIKKEAEKTDKYVDLKKARVSKTGDCVEIECKATIKDKEVSEFPSTMRILLNEEFTSFMPEVVKACTGINTGDHLTVVEKFGMDAGLPSLRGKDVSIAITVKNIQTVEKHTPDDSFAKEAGHENLDEMRKAVRENLEGQHKWLSDMYVKRHLLDALAQEYSFDLPKSMVDNEFNEIWTRLTQEIETARANGTLDEEDDKPEEELKKEYRAIAERRVRLGLVISEIASNNNIRLTTEDMRRALYTEVMKNPGYQEQIVNFFKKNPAALERLSAPILEDKVVTFILESAKVTEKALDLATFKKEISAVIPGFFEDEEEKTVAAKPTKAKPAKAKAEKAKG